MSEPAAAYAEKTTLSRVTVVSNVRVNDSTWVSRSADKGIARTQTPTNKNYALELFTFETIVGVNLSIVQWTGLEYSFQLAITAPLYSIIGYCIATAQSC